MGGRIRGQAYDPAQRKRLHQSQVAQGVERLERVVVVLALVVDAGQAGPEHEVIAGQDLVPELLHGLHLGEEPVPTDVETPTVALGGAGYPAHFVVCLQHGAGLAQAPQFEGGGETGRSRPDDDDVVRLPVRRVTERRRAGSGTLPSGWDGTGKVLLLRGGGSGTSALPAGPTTHSAASAAAAGQVGPDYSSVFQLGKRTRFSGS